jgi:hypothetical protein
MLHPLRVIDTLEGNATDRFVHRHINLYGVLLRRFKRNIEAYYSSETLWRGKAEKPFMLNVPAVLLCSSAGMKL